MIPLPHRLKHRTTTLSLIEKAVSKHSPDRLARFTLYCRTLGLNGVAKPFWRDWKFADPCTFLAPDALHQWHQFFWDHPMKWAKKLLKPAEIDKRYTCLQRRVGERHFRAGFLHLTQITGREKRDLTKHFIGVYPGHPSITPAVMDCLRGLIDFFYLAQYESHNTETLEYLDDALAAFHNNKELLSATGVRAGVKRQGKFNVQKIELFHHVGRLIRQLGSAPQFSQNRRNIAI